MGKRNKGENDNVKTKKKKSASNSEVANDDVTEEISCMKSTGNGKNKKILFRSDDSSRITSIQKITKEPNTTSSQRSRKNTRSNEINNMENIKTKQNKKIIFTEDNDEGKEVPINKVQKIKNTAEEDPGDEEIDKFCDELDEEDNEQYVNWVKLIEAKLGPNKKK